MQKPTKVSVANPKLRVPSKSPSQSPKNNNDKQKSNKVSPDNSKEVDEVEDFDYNDISDKDTKTGKRPAKTAPSSTKNAPSAPSSAKNLLSASSSTKGYNSPSETLIPGYHTFASIRYWIIRYLTCPIPGLKRSIPVIGGKSFLELIISGLVLIMVLVYSLRSDAGGVGQVANYLGMLLILLIMRNNFILSIFMGLSFENAINWHKLIAIALMIAMVIHGVREGFLASGVALASLIGCTSLIYGLNKYLHVINFNVFYFLHLGLYFGIVIAAFIHGATIFALSIIVWSIDFIFRYFLIQHSIPKEKVFLTKISNEIVKVSFPMSFRYQAGQYAFISIKGINFYEYHPFTISSSPHEDELSFHIKDCGDWTHKLMELADSYDNKSMVAVEGPYGEVSIDIFNANVYPVSRFPLFYPFLLLTNPSLSSRW